ncbi:3-keto-5-aminohexanoate cleavage protein [Caballeronia sp.]|uniref:3-keto-5-aminohexanoate cleavage protein n=1 Tax=Caballeronia sp. TaxID=1931223 RepID=UPI003C6ED480
MNSVCIVNTAFANLFRDDEPAVNAAGNAEFTDLLKTSVDGGTSVVDLGAVARTCRSEERRGQLRTLVSEARTRYPGIVFQVAGNSLFELKLLLKHFAWLDADIVSVPVGVFCEEGAVALLRAQRRETERLRKQLALDVDDLSLVFRAVTLQHDGLFDSRLRMNFCFGQKCGVPSDRDAFLFFAETLRRLAPEATWSGLGSGSTELKVAQWSIEMGGHCKATVAKEQGVLSQNGSRGFATLSKVTDLCKEYGRRPASFEEARNVLSLEAATLTSCV